MMKRATGKNSDRADVACPETRLGVAVPRVICFFLLCFFTSACFADETECNRLAARVDGPEDNYRPPLEASVIGKGRLYFYSAPSERCKMEGVFVVTGDVLTVYKSIGGWANVMYIARNGDDFMGWVLESRIMEVGQYGHNP